MSAKELFVLSTTAWHLDKRSKGNEGGDISYKKLLPIIFSRMFMKNRVPKCCITVLIDERTQRTIGSI